MYIVITLFPDGRFNSFIGEYEDENDATEIATILKEYYVDKIVEIKETCGSLTYRDIQNFVLNCILTNKKRNEENLEKFLKLNK